MIPLKMLQMQGARLPRSEGVLSVRRNDEEIEATQQMEYFQRNHLSICTSTLFLPQLRAFWWELK
jgi:hypothetical protein